jgi:hypothetical protein
VIADALYAILALQTIGYVPVAYVMLRASRW